MLANAEELGKATLAELQGLGLPGRLLLHQLDIADPQSVQRFVAWLAKEAGGCTILVNNAGFAFKGSIFGGDEAATTIGINYLGTRAMCEALRSLLKPPARIVNVSSRAGLRSIVRSPALLARFTGATSPRQLDELAKEFEAGIRQGTYKQAGWPDTMYGVSKLLESQYTQLLAAELKKDNVMVNAICPGWCSTDMSSHRGTKTAAEGADTAVWLALRSPKEFATGGFYAERSQINW